MKKVQHTLRWWRLSFLLMVCAGLFAGCGGGDHAPTVNQPPQPVESAYTVITSNYYYLYDEGAGSPPFNSSYQFTNGNYPIPVSYETLTTPPTGFELVEDSEDSIRAWAAADPRVAIISGVAPSAAHIRVLLEEKIVYGSYTNIIGLTSIVDTEAPTFKVEVATKYLGSGGDPENPADYIAMPADEVAKILMHELGHTLGLGHSPDIRDLMYFQSNANQGASYATYVTYGDALALWTTLNARLINWVPARPPVTPAAEPMTPTARTYDAGPRGEVLDIYTRQ